MSKIILCIEDNRDTLDLFHRMLSRHGYEVLRAVNSAEGMEFMATADVSVVLLDINLPGRNGFQILQDLKGMYRHIPVIAMTANSINASRKICLDAGFDGYISKPIVRQELVEVIQGFLSKEITDLRPTSL